MSLTYGQIRAREWIRHAEGGYVDHPRDPGGTTFAGVSLRAVVALKDATGGLEFDLDGDGDVDRDDIRELQRLYEAGDTSKVDEFYRERYWLPAACEAFRWPLQLAVFDAAVNHGVKAGVLFAQRALGVQADGIPGPKTRHAGSIIGVDRLKRAVRSMHVQRSQLYHELSKRRGDDFLAGWTARIYDLATVCAVALE